MDGVRVFPRGFLGKSLLNEHDTRLIVNAFLRDIGWRGLVTDTQSKENKNGLREEPVLITKEENMFNFMKLQTNGETLNVSGVKELGASNSNSFRDQVRAALTEAQKFIEIDLSQTNFVDSCGLGALISLHKTICGRNGLVRLLNPTPPVQQILELTRMHRIFEIVKR